MDGRFPVRRDGVGLGRCVRGRSIFLGVFRNKMDIVTYKCGVMSTRNEGRKVGPVTNRYGVVLVARVWRSRWQRRHHYLCRRPRRRAPVHNPSVDGILASLVG